MHSSSAPKVDLRVLELQAAKEVGSMSKSDLARRLQIRRAELDLILQELEHVGKVKLSEAKGKLVVGLRDVTS